MKLIKDLYSRGTLSCGTVRMDRGAFPVSFKTKKMKKCEAVFLKSEHALTVHWKYKRDVFALSSISDTSLIEIDRREEDEPIIEPSLVREYNHFMNGVDKCDQFINYYAIGRKSMKWWRKVFFRLVELAIVNSTVLYFSVNPEFCPAKTGVQENSSASGL